MPNPTEIICHWIDAQPEGALIRTLDLEHLVDRNKASRALARLARRGRLMRMARGMHVAGDVVRALEWLGPDLAEQAIGKLGGRIGQDDWAAMLEAKIHLPAWMVVAIQNGLATTIHDAANAMLYRRIMCGD